MNSKEFKKSMKSYFPIIIIIIISILSIFILLNLTDIFNFINKLISISTPIIIGSVMAYIVVPLHKKVYLLFYNKITKLEKNINPNNKIIKKIIINNKQFISNLMAIISAITIWILLLFGLIFIVLPELISSMNTFLSNSNNYQIAIREYIDNLPLPSIFNKDKVVVIFDDYINNAYNLIRNSIFPNLNNIIQNIFDGFRSTVGVVTNIMIGLIIMIYILFKQDHIVLQIKKLIYALTPERYTKWLIDEIKYANKTFTNFFSGKILDSIIIFILSYIIFLFAKIPYALLLSLMVGITNIVPFFGPIVGAIICLTFVLLVAPEKLIMFAILIFLIQQFDGNILGPKILSDKTGVDSFYVLCATIIFGGLFGFIGMIVAVPVWAIIYRIIDEILINKLKNKKLPTKSKDFADI